LNASVPVTAWAVIPVSPKQVSGIPSIALEIPDFEGSATLQLFANSTRTQIGCFRAVMRNANSFSHPYAIGSILGAFAVAAMLCSFATAVYGVSIVHMRTHYAHSLPVLVVFDTFQSIFFSGALSVNWPSVLPAWWSNFAWSAGMIYSKNMVDAIDAFTGVRGNASQVGGAGSVVISTSGGIIQQIYGRSLATTAMQRLFGRAHAAYNASNPYDYTWAGRPVTPGMPTPGTWTGFAGALSTAKIPASDAFLVGLIWILIAVAGIALLVVAFKFLLDLLARMKWAKEDRLSYFRSHLWGYVGVAVLRTLFIAFFALVTLALLEFNFRGPAGPLAIAAIVFILALVGTGGLVAYACYFRLRAGKFEVGPDKIVFERGKLFGAIPFVAPTRASSIGEKELASRSLGSIGFFRIRHVNDDPERKTVHNDEAYTKRFGWLSARYRRTRWWFFAWWLAYQLIRACFIGGAARNPLGQVFGLFVYDIFAFVAVVTIKPFEGSRNTVIGVWLLGLCKIATTGFSIAFLPAFGLGRIMSTVFGIVIIVIQGFIVIAVMILVILGAISSWMSLSRNREDFNERLDGMRIKYFEHLEEAAPDLPRQVREKRQREREKKKKKLQKRAEQPEVPEVPKEPYFSVTSVRRAPKIEDEDRESGDEGDATGAMDLPRQSTLQFAPVNRPSRTPSVSSHRSVSSLPRAARTHRASWSASDFAQWDAQQLDRPDSAMSQRMNARPPGHSHSRSNSLRIAAMKSSGSLSQQMMWTETPTLEHKGSSPGLRRPMTPTRETAEDGEYITTGVEPRAAWKSASALAAAEEKKEEAAGEKGLVELSSPSPSPPSSLEMKR
jgi:hypothetical protein